MLVRSRDVVWTDIWNTVGLRGTASDPVAFGGPQVLASGVRGERLDTGLISEQLARRLQLAIGDRIEVPAPGGNWPLEVVGIYADYGNPKGQVGVNIDGLAFDTGSSGDQIGANASSQVSNGGSTLYRYYVPKDPETEGTHYIRPGPGNRDAVSLTQRADGDRPWSTRGSPSTSRRTRRRCRERCRPGRRPRW